MSQKRYTVLDMLKEFVAWMFFIIFALTAYVMVDRLVAIAKGIPYRPLRDPRLPPAWFYEFCYRVAEGDPVLLRGIACFMFLGLALWTVNIARRNKGWRSKLWMSISVADLLVAIILSRI